MLSSSKAMLSILRQSNVFHVAIQFALCLRSDLAGPATEQYRAKNRGDFGWTSVRLLRAEACR
jgi:hypothetical protein